VNPGTRVRRALDALLAHYPAFDLLRVDWQIDPGDERRSPHWAGSWVLVDLGQPSDLIDLKPAWAVWRFAIWRATGAVHQVGPDGAVIDPPIIEGES
jgi:hypothetical protein